MPSGDPPWAYIGSTTISHSWVGTNFQRAVLTIGVNAPDIARYELEFGDEVVEGSLGAPSLAPSCCESGISIRKKADDVTVDVTFPPVL